MYLVFINIKNYFGFILFYSFYYFYSTILVETKYITISKLNWNKARANINM